MEKNTTWLKKSYAMLFEKTKIIQEFLCSNISLTIYLSKCKKYMRIDL